MNLSDIKLVPNKPGIYIFKDDQDAIIYVGKAKKIKARLTQYIKGSINSYKTQQMMSKIQNFEYIITKNEWEALLLEKNYIAKWKPEYNILLMDDKNYPYIMINLQKDFLNIKLVYRTRKKMKNTIYFGPFPTGYGAKRMADLINRMSVYEKGFPKRNASSAYWAEQFEFIKKLISNRSSLKSELKNKMILAASKQQFEIAHDIKETLNSLQFSQEKQGIAIVDKRQIDSVVFYEKNGYLSYAQSFYRQGNLLSIKSDVFEVTTTIEDAARQFLNQFYDLHLKPDLLISNLKIYLEDIDIIVPVKGEKKQIVEIGLENAMDNISQKLIKFIRHEQITLGALNKLKSYLNLPKLNHIMMIDNSNTANINPVSAIVSYRNGIKNKAEYKRFKLEKTDRQADVEYMRQGTKRYFNNPENPIPDLYIVDGGQAQVNEIKKIIPEVKVIGLVKNDKHVTESIIDLNNQKSQISDPDLLAFLKNIQIEVDRFAKSLHRKINVTSSLEGKLLNIKGIGRQTESKLLAKFGNYAGIYNASVNDLAKVVSLKIAELIKEEI